VFQTIGSADIFLGGAGNLAYTGGQYGMGNNVGIGQGALTNMSNGSGAQNTAIGQSVLGPDTTGTFNVGIGQGALSHNTTGSYNMGNGASSLGLCTNGSYNIANGVQALYGLTSGTYNTGDGAYSIYGITTGSTNIALGYYAGHALVTSNSYNIDIGNVGVAGDMGVIRIGTVGQQTTNIMAGYMIGNGGGLTNIPPTGISGVAAGYSGIVTNWQNTTYSNRLYYCSGVLTNVTIP
jgi:hypothetical protein